MIELDDAGSWSVATEEFLALIHRSTELMRENRQEDARKTLEAAFESRKNEPSSQATLGLVYFKLGIYPRAVDIYKKLVKEFPTEPTLRLNLGLAYLKTGQTGQAVRELETVIRLSPDYRKAEGYLGLAYERLGEYPAAKRAFERAGAKHLAERMEQLINNAQSVPFKENGKRAVTEDGQTAPVEEENGISEKLTDFIENQPIAQTPTSHPVSTTTVKEPISIRELAVTSRLLEPICNHFLINENGYLIADIDSHLFCRLSGLHFLTGEQITYRPIQRRYRGRNSDEIFGENDNPMFDVSGSGRLGFHPKTKVFTAILLEGDAAFVKERYLFAMAATLSYENGRIPGNGDRLVHINGRGAIVLQTPNTLRVLETAPASGLIIPEDDLVGWFGRLLPKPTSKGPFEPGLTPLEIRGEGTVLFCLS